MTREQLNTMKAALVELNKVNLMLLPESVETPLECVIDNLEDEIKQAEESLRLYRVTIQLAGNVTALVGIVEGITSGTRLLNETKSDPLNYGLIIDLVENYDGTVIDGGINIPKEHFKFLSSDQIGEIRRACEYARARTYTGETVKNNY